MGKIIGIDFGTSSSYMTYVTEETVKFIEVQGSSRIPSLIYFPENESDKTLFGQQAKRQALLNPERTIVAVKKLLGKTYEEVKPFLPQLSYKVIPDAAGFPVIDLGNTIFHPQEVIALFLIHLREQAAEALGEMVEECVVTIPANFNPHEIASIREAFEIAGWQIKRLLAEPTAALLAARFAQQESESDDCFLVLDIGGSSTDVSIQETGGGVFEVKSISGDNMLGGIDFDHVLVKDLVYYFYEKEGVNYASDKVALYRLWEAAEKAKIELSSFETAHLQLPFMSVHGVLKTLEATVNREQFERASSPLVQRCLDLCRIALSAAGQRPEDVDGYFLVGAACRTPFIKEEMERFFGEKSIGNFNPEEVVAIGAGIQAGILTGSDLSRGWGVLLLDIHPFSAYAALPEEVSRTEEIVRVDDKWTTRPATQFGNMVLLMEFGSTIPTKYGFYLYFNDIQKNKSYKINIFDYRNGKQVIQQPWEIDIPAVLFGDHTQAKVKLSWDIDPNSRQTVSLENEQTQTRLSEVRKKVTTSLSSVSMAELRKRLFQRDQLSVYKEQLNTYSTDLPPGLHQRISLGIKALEYANKIKHVASQYKFSQQIDALFQDFAQKQMIGFDDTDSVLKTDESLKRAHLPGIIEHLTYRVDTESKLMRFIREVLDITSLQECALFGSRLTKINGEFSMGLIERQTFITEMNRIRLGLIHFLEELVLNKEILPPQFQNISIFAEANGSADERKW